MSVDNYTRTDGGQGPAPVVIALPERRRLRRHRGPRRPRPRVRKLRLLFVLTGFAALAVISLLFGALTSIASDLPKFKSTVQFSHTADSYMYDINGTPIGPLAPASTPAIDNWDAISPNMVNAIVAVEDRGFWGESGISVRGLVRAALADVTGGKIQGASTIPEEFIKNVRQEEGDRTVAEKLVEAGMAFQLSHHWKHKHILTEYLNTIYFGNGALGIEAAARVYFGWAHGYDPANPAEGGPNSCGDADPQHPHRPECASVLTPAQAALLAGMVANPSAFNPAGTPSERSAAQARRDLVLQDMYNQHYISYGLYQYSMSRPLPTAAQIREPQQQPSAAPYFTSWVEPQVVRTLEREGLTAKEAQYQADYGGLKIKLSIDLNLQNQAQTVIRDELPPGEGLPSASLVAISNKTGEVRAMVSGNSNYEQSPFNLATMGYRQPGSSFKIFTLATALSEGKITPYTEFDSKQVTIPFVKKDGNAFYAANGTGLFPVHNFGNVYSGSIPMTVATATSDNSVFAQLGMTKVGTASVANYAKLMGIRSPVSVNPSMILGGLNTGVTALDMAHAYSTVANGGAKLFNPYLGDNNGPIGIDSISGCVRVRSRKTTITNTRADDEEGPGAHARGRLRDRLASPRTCRRQLRNRHRRRHPRRRRGRQDRHHVQLHRRVVRRLDPAADSRGLGRLPRQRQADDDRLLRQAGGGWHLSRSHLAQLRGRRASDPAGRGAAQVVRYDHGHHPLLDLHGRDRHDDLDQHNGSVDHSDDEHDPDDHRGHAADVGHQQRRRQLRDSELGRQHVEPDGDPAAVNGTTALVAHDRRWHQRRIVDQRRNRALSRVPHRHREVRTARQAEAPRQLGRLGYPDPEVPLDHRIAEARRPPRDHDRPAGQVAAVVGERDVERLGELAGPRAERSDS